MKPTHTLIRDDSSQGCQELVVLWSFICVLAFANTSTTTSLRHWCHKIAHEISENPLLLVYFYVGVPLLIYETTYKNLESI